MIKRRTMLKLLVAHAAHANFEAEQAIKDGDDRRAKRWLRISKEFSLMAKEYL